MARMIKAIAILFVSGVAMITAGCETNRPGQSIVQSPAAQRDRVQVASGKRTDSSVLEENRTCAATLRFEKLDIA